MLNKKEIAIAIAAAVAAASAVTIGGIQSANGYAETRKCDELQARYNADRVEWNRLLTERTKFSTRVEKMAQVNPYGVVAAADYFTKLAFEIDGKIEDHEAKVQVHNSEFKSVCGQDRFDAAVKIDTLASK